MTLSWLAATYLRAVPMETYPRPPVAAMVSADVVDEGEEGERGARGEDPPAEATPLRFISTATQ
jgi:hypothetical protein